MASYTAEQLSGTGSLTEALSGEKEFKLRNPFSGSSYFTFETVRNNDGFYDENSPTNALGTYEIEEEYTSSIQTLVTSSYIFSVVVSPGGPYSINFTPTTSVSQSSAYLRATGGVSLIIL